MHVLKGVFQVPVPLLREGQVIIYIIPVISPLPGTPKVLTGFAVIFLVIAGLSKVELQVAVAETALPLYEIDHPGMQVVTIKHLHHL